MKTPDVTCRDHRASATRLLWVLVSSLAGAGCGSSSAGGANANSPDCCAPINATCDATNNVEEVATAALVQIEAEMAAEGYERRTYSVRETITGTNSEQERLAANRVDAPRYFASEADLLALPDEDRLRRAYVDGDLDPIDWSVDGVLAILVLQPYTDTHLFEQTDQLVVYSVRLEACLASRAPPDPLPVEFARQKVYVVPKFETLEHRSVSRWFRMHEFPADPAWGRHPAGALIHRQGWGSAVVRADDTYHLWVNGYSGASGFIFWAESGDGIDWSFHWAEERICVFEDMPDIQVWKLNPTVLWENGTFTMWVDASGDALPSGNGIYRLTSTDGRSWVEPLKIRMHNASWSEEFYAPVVAHHDGLYHLWGENYSVRTVSHATSLDGVDWFSDGEVLEPGSSIDDLDGFGTYMPGVYHDGDKWVMIYTAAYTGRELLTSSRRRIWYQMHLASATSPDGVHWQKQPVPILNQIRTTGHWESRWLWRPMVLQVGSETRVYYSAFEGGEPSMGLVTATDWVF